MSIVEKFAEMLKCEMYGMRVISIYKIYNEGK